MLAFSSRFWTLVALASVACGQMWADPTPDSGIAKYLSPENLKKLEGGEMVTLFGRSQDGQGNSVGQGVVVGLINKPMEDVWRVMLDIKSHPEYLPKVVKTEIYQEEKDGVTGIRETLKILYKTIRYHVLQHRDEAAHRLTWTLDKSKKNDIADTSGYWAFAPHGEKQCVAVYSVHVDSGLPVPQFVEDFLSRKDLPNVVRAVKDRAESLASDKS